MNVSFWWLMCRKEWNHAPSMTMLSNVAVAFWFDESNHFFGSLWPV